MDVAQFATQLSENISGELATVIISALPFFELRGGIPAALFIYNLPLWKAFFLGILGNLLPILPILFFLEKISLFLMSKSALAKKFFSWLFERTRKRFYKKYEIYGDIALIVFVAIPFPTTGAWTGSLAAFLFGIRKLPAFAFISIGVVIAAVIVTLASTGLSLL